MTQKPIGPLDVDPGELKNIRPMVEKDIIQISKIHQEIMGNTLLGKLGTRFLMEIYSGLLEHESFVGYVYLDSKKVKGFIAGSDDGPKMMKEVFRKRWRRLTWAALKGIAMAPTAIFPLFSTFHYFSKSGVRGLEDIKAESMFCAFEKEFRGKRISGLINQVLFNELAHRGRKYVKITTESDNKGAFRQLSSWGFEKMGTFRFYGKEMTAWRLDLENCPRVDISN